MWWAVLLLGLAVAALVFLISGGHVIFLPLLLILRPNRDDRELPVEKDDVDRKAHEEGVHRPAGLEEEPFSLGEAVPPEKPAHPRPGPVGDPAALHNHRAGSVRK